ncbi:hypothetical protein C8Q74DRAFT_933006 [Fomes fomentarius]|nr:hypothetical protein C8Q74DRAFT_933006 [Fomes fomentarius]
MLKSKVAVNSTVGRVSSPQDAMKQALLAVVQVWLDRLQQQALVTTFFVSIHSLLFSLTATTRKPDLNDWSNRDMVVNASLGGAIIFHVCASIVAYVGSFVLIRYRLNDAEKKEEGTIYQPSAYTSTRTRAASTSQYPTEKQHARSGSRTHASHPSTSTTGPSSPLDIIENFPMEVFTDLRGMVSVHRTHPLWFLSCGKHRSTAKCAFDPEGPSVDDAVATLKGMVGTLSRAHTVCAGMSSLGFILALLGILTYSWTAVPLPLGIFASACMGACGIVAAMALW